MGNLSMDLENNEIGAGAKLLPNSFALLSDTPARKDLRQKVGELALLLVVLEHVGWCKTVGNSAEPTNKLARKMLLNCLR